MNHRKPHFQTVHGKFGLATFSAALLVAGGGVVSFRRAGLITKLPEGLQPKVKWAHRSAGVLVWLLSLVTVELALLHKSVWKGTVSRFWQAGTAVLGLAVAGLWLTEGREAKRKLPVYQQLEEYGIVSAADE